MLTKVPGDHDVVAAALTSGVIMGIVWGQHGSLWSREVSSARSCSERNGNSRQNSHETNVNQPQTTLGTENHKVQSEGFKPHQHSISALSQQVKQPSQTFYLWRILTNMPVACNLMWANFTTSNNLGDTQKWSCKQKSFAWITRTSVACRS